MIWACTWLEGCTDLRVLSRGTLTAAGYHYHYPTPTPSQGPLGHQVSLHPLLSHRSSNRPRVDWCPNPGLAGDPSWDLIISSRACLGGAGGAYRHQEARNIKSTICVVLRSFTDSGSDFIFILWVKFLNPVLSESMIWISTQYSYIDLFSVFISTKIFNLISKDLMFWLEIMSSGLLWCQLLGRNLY